MCAAAFMIEDHPGQAAVVSESSNEVLLLKEQLTDLTEQVALLTTSREHQQSVICRDEPILPSKFLEK